MNTIKPASNIWSGLIFKTPKNYSMIKEFFQDDPILSGIILLLTMLMLFIVIDGVFSNRVYLSGIVVDKHYEAENTRTGTGVGVTSNGQTAVVITSESEPEKFLIMVKTKTGKIITAKCKAELYYSKKEGQLIEYCISKGLFTKLEWSIKGVK